MEATSYVSLSKQHGLLREMDAISHNIANMATDGFRQRNIVFSEYVDGFQNGESVSAVAGNVNLFSTSQGAVKQTNGSLDFAILGSAFFKVETDEGVALTKAGSFTRNAEGTLVTSQGYPVLDENDGQIVLPGNGAAVMVAKDGTISADGEPLGRLGIFVPADGAATRQMSGSLLQVDSVAAEPAENQVLQGHIEGSNVDPIAQMTRMIEVQRLYETSQRVIDMEHEQTRSLIATLIK